MTLLDKLGERLSANGIEIDNDTVTKTYNRMEPDMAWGFLERKPYQSPKERYEREKYLLKFLGSQGMAVPRLISCDDEALEIRTEKLSLEPIATALENDRKATIEEMLTLLKRIHSLGASHGDPYLKNWFMNGKVHCLDFEYQRNSPDNKAYDVILLAANITSALGHTPTLEIDAAYGKVNFQFDARDKLFFKARFGCGKEFFDYFSQN